MRAGDGDLVLRAEQKVLVNPRGVSQMDATDFFPAAARTMFDCSLRSRGSRFVATAFLSHSQTKSVSARSFVQASGARSWALWIRILRRRSLKFTRRSWCVAGR